jgi:pseudouridine synthase
MNAGIRINRFMATAGLGSRRKCEDLIRRGLVFVNGRRIENLSLVIDAARDIVEVDGKQVTIDSKTLVLVLNKPTGVLSTVSDPWGRRTVIDIARENDYEERLYPVGRLDLDSSGILILTNDGDLAYRLTHPGFKVEKTYLVTVEGEANESNASKIARGIRKSELTTLPCTVKILKRTSGTTMLEVKLKEGKKRQIRRMFDTIGYRVVKLHRRAFGDLEFKDLKTGEMRPLTAFEENRLRELTDLT